VAVELTTVVRVEGASTDSLESLAKNLEDAVATAINDLGMAAVTAYFVVPERSQLQVGLRFEGMAPENIEGTATDVLEHAIQIATSVEHKSEVRRVRSQLVSA
jgi:hypothetical protein